MKFSNSVTHVSFPEKRVTFFHCSKNLFKMSKTAERLEKV